MRYLYHACWYAWLGMKWWSLVESAVKQAVVLPLFMYEIIAIAALLLTQVCAFVCDACYKAFVRMQGVCALPWMKSSQLAQICPHAGSTLRQIQSDKYRSTTQGFDEVDGGTIWENTTDQIFYMIAKLNIKSKKEERNAKYKMWYCGNDTGLMWSFIAFHINHTSDILLGDQLNLSN